MMLISESFLLELKRGLTSSPHAALAPQVETLTVHEFTHTEKPIAQFVYTVPRSSLPEGPLTRIVLRVPGLFCLFVDEGRIVAIETFGRDVLDDPNRAH
jgi:hypothetical protein